MDFFKFKGCKSRLYYYDTEKKYDKSEENNNTNENAIINYSCLQTVKENTNFPNREEISRASKARRYQ